MDFPRVSFTTSRGMTYSYIYIPQSQSQTQTQTHSKSRTLLFLHGFPSLAVDFHNQITCFSSLGYEILAPDLLGYGDSSHPTSPEDYSHKLIVNDLIEILDHYSITTVIGIAHDFGAQILTRLDFYFPSRMDKLIFLTIGPITPGQPFDLDAVNEMTKNMLGYEGYGYQEFLTRDPDATELLTERTKSFHNLMFTSNHELWKDWFGKRGGLKKWLEEDQSCDVIAGFTNDLERAHISAFSRHSDGAKDVIEDRPKNKYEGIKNWYTTFANNQNIPDDLDQLSKLSEPRREGQGEGNQKGENEEENKKEEKYKTVPGKRILLITATKDVIAFPNIQEQMTKSIMSDPSSDLTVKQLDTGHWVMLEKAQDVNLIIDEFLNQK